MGAPDADVAAHLAAAGLGLTLGTNLFRGKVQAAGAPGIPDLAVFVLATGGPAPEAYCEGGATVERRFPGVQVTTRSDPRAFVAGQTLARSMRTALHHATVAGYVDVAVSESEPNYLGEDEEGRHAWTSNLDLLIEE